MATLYIQERDDAGNWSETTGASATIDLTAPAVFSVEVKTGLSVDVTFSEQIGVGVTTADRYTVSGDGAGNLAGHPNSVTAQEGYTYRLTWDGGEMGSGKDITITVADIYDLAGNSIGSPARS